MNHFFRVFSLFLFSLVLLTGCLNDPMNEEEETPTIKGYWKASYGDGFSITDTTFTQYDNAAKDISFAGDIVNTPDFTASTGSITIKITDSGSWGKTVDHYYVIKWKNFKNGSIQQSAAYKADGDNDGLADKNAAEAEYTIDNGYFSFFGDYIEQTEPSTINGYWKSSYGDGFSITATTFTQYDNAAKDISFAGDIVSTPDFTASTGTITIKITNSGSWDKTMDHYYVIKWKNFKNDAIQQSSAYKSGGDNDGLADQNAAESEYTIDNGYFSFYGDYVKQ